MRKINIDVAIKERALLESGMSYREVSSITGTRKNTVESRNRFHYKIDVVNAFENRIKRDGIRNNLFCDDSFGNWFSGIFDGEGNFQVSGAKGKQYLNLAIRITLRIDDMNTIKRIYNILGGTIYVNSGYSKRKDKNLRSPCIEWKLYGIKNLAEVVIPLFKKYNLYTKKREEFIYFEKLVIYQYIRTLGGVCFYSQRPRNIIYLKEIFQNIQDIRHPTKDYLNQLKDQANVFKSQILIEHRKERSE